MNVSYTNTEKVRNVIKSLVDNGLAKGIDLDRTNVQLTNISANRTTAGKCSLNFQKTHLSFIWEFLLKLILSLKKKTIEPKPELIAGNVDLDTRTEVKVLQKNRELLQYNKKATEAYLYPTVGLQANYGWAGQGSKFPLTNGINNGVLWSDYSAIGLNINIPIFTGGATKSKIQQAEIDILDIDQDIRIHN